MSSKLKTLEELTKKGSKTRRLMSQSHLDIETPSRPLSSDNELSSPKRTKKGSNFNGIILEKEDVSERAFDQK